MSSGHSAALASQDDSVYIGTRARVAVYDSLASAPRVEEVGPAPAPDFIESLSSRVYEIVRERGGSIPYTVVREIAENLIHAGFAEPVISVLDDGATLRFSDRGPGIRDKQRALLPGFTTASSSMKSVIRGVGSGLPIVSEFLSVTGGRLSIEDNLEGGCVVTVNAGRGAVGFRATPQPPTTPKDAVSHSSAYSAPLFVPEPDAASEAALPKLTKRQEHVLALILENGVAGPSFVSQELGVGLSTAHRDLASLEKAGLISSDEGKRTLTDRGLSYLGIAPQ